MNNEPVDIGTPYMTREDIQDSIDRLSIKIDDLEKGKIKNKKEQQKIVKRPIFTNLYNLKYRTDPEKWKNRKFAHKNSPRFSKPENHDFSRAIAPARPLFQARHFLCIFFLKNYKI